MGWAWASGYSAYKNKSDRLNADDFFGTSVKDVCKDIKNRAEDLKDCAAKIREICTDLDTGSKLVVNGQTYGQHIIGIAEELDAKYEALFDRCDTILSDARARRADEDDWGYYYQQYEKEQRELAKENNN